MMFRALELPVLLGPVQRRVLMRASEREDKYLALPAHDHRSVFFVDLCAVLRRNRIGLVLPSATERGDELHWGSGCTRRGRAEGNECPDRDESCVAQKVAPRDERAASARSLI